MCFAGDGGGKGRLKILMGVEDLVLAGEEDEVLRKPGRGLGLKREENLERLGVAAELWVSGPLVLVLLLLSGGRTAGGPAASSG